MVNNHGPQTHAAQAAAMNTLNARMIDAIRSIDSKVWIAIDGPVRSSGGVRWLDPALFADQRTIFCYHHYPLEAHEGSVNYERNQSCRDENADDEVFLRQELREEIEFAARIDRPVVLGEFGLPAHWDPFMGSRTLKAQLKIHEALGWGWLLWSYKDVNTMDLLNPTPDRPWRNWVEDPARTERSTRVCEAFHRYYDEAVIPNLPKTPANSRTHDAAFDDARRGFTRVLLDSAIRDLAQIPAATRSAMMEDFNLRHCTVREDIWRELAPWLGSTEPMHSL
jgi:Cellulase (glycosyl hydrolase family 5)